MDKEENMKLLSLFDLNSLCSIVNILPKSKGVNKSVSFDILKNMYTITINDGSYIIKCNDGRELAINGWIDTITTGDEYGLDEDACGCISIIYKMFDNSKVVLNKRWIGPKWYNYNSFENVTLEDFAKASFTREATPGVNFYTKLEENGDSYLIARYPDNYSYTGEITKNGIILDRCVMSPDLDKIITFDNEIAPSEEEVRSFDGEKEEKRIIDLINNSDLSSKTKEFLIEDVDISNVKDYYKDLLFYYDNVLPLTRKANVIGNKLKNGEAHKWLFTKDELQYSSFMIRLFTTNGKYKDIHNEMKSITKEIAKEKKKVK